MEKIKQSSMMTLVKCCFCYGCALGLVSNCFGIFFSPIANDLELTIGSLSVIITLRSLTTAFFSLVLAKLIGKIELRWIMSFGVILCALMYFLMSVSTELWQFYLNGLIVGIGSCCFSTLPVTCVLQNWYKDKAGSVTGIAMAFSGIMGALFNPLCSYIVKISSWQMGIRTIGVMLLIFALPSTLTLRLSDSSAVAPKKKTGEFNLSVSRFVWLALVCVLFTTGVSLNSHISALGVSAGNDLTFSASMVSAAMIGNIVFKLIMGVLSDKIGAFYSSVCGALVTALGIFCLTFASIPLFAYLGSFMFGCSFFCASLCITTLVRMVAGAENYAAVYSKISVITSIASAAFTALAGMAYDHFGSYNQMILLLVGTMILSAGCSILLGKKIEKRGV